MANLRHALENHPACRILREHNAPLMLDLLDRFFKEEGRPEMELQVLEEDLEKTLLAQYNTEPGDDGPAATARRYLKEWTREKAYLRTHRSETGQEMVRLTSGVEKAFQMVALAARREFVGTESRLERVFEELAKIVQGTEVSQEEVLAGLEKEKEDIQRKIDEVKRFGPQPLSESQIAERYQEVERTAQELLGDFTEVEENFKDLTRRLFDEQVSGMLTKGRLVSNTLDGKRALRDSYEGQSFYAFLHLIRDEDRKAYLDRLIEKVVSVLEERLSTRRQPFSMRRLRKRLSEAANRVSRQNDVLTHRLAVEVAARQPEQGRQVKASIQQILAFVVAHKEEALQARLELETRPRIELPLERKLTLTETPETVKVAIEETPLTLDVSRELGALVRLDLLPRREVLRRLEANLAGKPNGCSLRHAFEGLAMEHGLPELLTYISCALEQYRFTENKCDNELIPFAPARALRLPLVSLWHGPPLAEGQNNPV